MNVRRVENPERPGDNQTPRRSVAAPKWVLPVAPWFDKAAEAKMHAQREKYYADMTPESNLRAATLKGKDDDLVVGGQSVESSMIEQATRAAGTIVWKTNPRRHQRHTGQVSVASPLPRVQQVPVQLQATFTAKRGASK